MPPDLAEWSSSSRAYVELPAAATADVLGAAPRTLCLWARTDTFVQKAGLFNYGANADRNEFGLRARTEEGVIRVQFFGGDYDYDETLPGAVQRPVAVTIFERFWVGTQ